MNNCSVENTGGNGGGGSGGNGNNIEGFVFFYHPDHLGSSSYITDANGEVSQHLEYFAFGETFVEEHSNKDATPYLYNAKELDEETGLYYYGARYYDPVTNIWQSVDPPALDGRYLDGQLNNGFFNPSNQAVYGYTYQNPVRLTDPDGNNPIVPAIAVGAAVYSMYTNEINSIVKAINIESVSVGYGAKVGIKDFAVKTVDKTTFNVGANISKFTLDVENWNATYEVAEAEAAVKVRGVGLGAKASLISNEKMSPIREEYSFNGAQISGTVYAGDTESSGTLTILNHSNKTNESRPLDSSSSTKKQESFNDTGKAQFEFQVGIGVKGNFDANVYKEEMDKAD